MGFADGFWFGLGRIAAEASLAGLMIIMFGVVAAMIIAADARSKRRWDERRKPRSGPQG